MISNCSDTVSRRHVVSLALGALVALPRRGTAATTSSSGHSEHARRGAGGVLTTGSRPAQETQDPGVAQLKSPGTAGRPRARVIAGDNDPFVISLEHRLKCNCGCAHSIYACRTTDFSCGFWQELHAEVIAMAEQNMTAEEIIDAYVTKHGELYLMAPVPEGFNITGYLLPGAVISSIAAVMIWVMKRKTAMAAAPVQDGAASSLSTADQARLEAEMRELDL